MDKKFESEHEPSPESIQAFSELVDREAYRQRLLDEKRDWGWPPTAVNCMVWQPCFKMEDFNCSPSTVDRLEKSADKPSSTAGAGNGSREVEDLKRARKDVKRTRELNLVVVDGEEKVRKKKATTMGTMKWDLNKGVEFSDDND